MCPSARPVSELSLHTPLVNRYRFNVPVPVLGRVAVTCRLAAVTMYFDGRSVKAKWSRARAIPLVLRPAVLPMHISWALP
jgi:hypothetical protein